MGADSKILPGDVQLMSAGSGVTHSEFNGSDEAPLHFLVRLRNPHTLQLTAGKDAAVLVFDLRPLESPQMP